MSVTVAVRVVVLTRNAGAGCCEGGCVYQPAIIALIRDTRAWAWLVADESPAPGYDLADLLGSALNDHERERWAVMLADVARAEDAGCATDEEISRFLCPLTRGTPGEDR